ncbi:MAG: alanine dehydrogenase [Vicinamibacteria bacterium]
MDIGIPRETREREHRVLLTPSAVKAIVQASHRVFVETGAGAGAGHPDADYQSAGGTIAFSRMEVFARAELVGSVHAPEPRDFALLQPRQVVFAFWALAAARPEDIRALLERQVTVVGLEAIEDDHGRAPVLTSMSEIAGALAVTVGAGLLLNEFGGKGLLLGGVPGVPAAHFVVLGAGVLGRAAARVALGAGADVTLLDRSLERLRDASVELGPAATTMLSTRPNIEKALSFADLVLGAVAVHGERAPVLATREMLRLMKPRSVVMDLAIDMGGCFETSRPTAFPSATYEVDGILHFCVPNLPSVAARSATLALTNVLLPYLAAVADHGFEGALPGLPELRRGTYLHRGHCTRESLARAFGLGYTPLLAAGGTGE